MKDKIAQLMQKKNTYVIFAVLFGLIMWLFVLDFTNPWVAKSIEVQLDIRNETTPANNGLANNTIISTKTITVKLRGRADTVNTVTNTDISAYVDFNGISKTGKIMLKVNIDNKKIGVNIEEYSPKQIEYTFDKYINSYIDVKVEFDQALLKENYKLLNITCEPDRIPVSGFESIVNELEAVRVIVKDGIDIGSIDRDKTVSLLGKYYDKNGNDLSLKFDTEKVLVRIEVAKEVPLKYTISGEPATDYYILSHSISQNTVQLKGKPEDLASINEVNLGVIDVNGVTKDIIKEIDINLSDVITVYGLNKVTVNVNIENYIEKSFIIDDSILNKPGIDKDKYVYEISPLDFTILIKGKLKDLENLQRSALNPIIDVAGKGPGVYRIPLSITIGTEYTIIGEYVYNVTITIAPPVPSETKKPTDVPAASPTPENAITATTSALPTAHKQ